MRGKVYLAATVMQVAALRAGLQAIHFAGNEMRLWNSPSFGLINIAEELWLLALQSGTKLGQTRCLETFAMSGYAVIKRNG